MKRFEQELNGLKWIDIEGPSAADLKKISTELNLPEHALVSCLDPENLPKYETHPEGTLVILRTYDTTAKASANSMQDISTKISLFITPDFIITIHRANLPFLDEHKNSTSKSTESLKDFLKFLLSQVLLSFDVPLTDLENKTLTIEEKIYALQKNRILRNGYILKRRASAFKKIFRFTTEVLNKMSSHQELIWEEFQDVRDLLDRLSFYADEVFENITGLMNLHISLLSQKTNEASFKTNEVMRVLTVVSIFFLPLNFIAGVYGMNFEHMPELKTPYGYFITLGVMGLVALSIFLYARKKGWLAPPDNPS